MRNSSVDKIFKKRKRTLVFTTGVALLAVFSLGVSTYAWFQANAAVNIDTESDSANITVSAPTGAKFYYFTGNGTPNSDYTGYSGSDSAIGTAPRVLSHTSNSDVPSNVGFASTEGKTYYFVEIDGNGNNTAANCFNLSKIRPGCYYTYCIEYSAASCGLKLTFSNGTTGNNKTPKRKVGSSAAPGSAYDVSLGLALNGWVSSPQASSYAATYIKDAFNGGATKSVNDKIDYPTSDMANNTDFTFTSGQNTSSNHFIFFTIFMGFNDKTDALLFNNKAGTGSSEILYYTRDSSSGNYSALEGLTMTLSKIEVTTA